MSCQNCENCTSCECGPQPEYTKKDYNKALVFHLCFVFMIFMFVIMSITA